MFSVYICVVLCITVLTYYNMKIWQKPQFCNTSLFQKSVLNMGVKLYKFLPSKITKLKNINCFRKEEKLVLMKNLFHTLEEFRKTKSMR
jgi:hypothetical protein